MINVNCLNNIASVGLDLFSSDYNANATFEEADFHYTIKAKINKVNYAILLNCAIHFNVLI